LTIEVTNLNPESTSTIDSVFTVHTTRETTELWIEDGKPAVTFYRMDTGAPIESEDDAVVLSEDETALVGLEVETGTKHVVLKRITVHAAVPDSSDPAASETETATDTVTETVETPTEDETTETETPTATGTTTETETTEGETTVPETPTATVTATPVDTEPGTPTDSGGTEPTETPPAQIEIVSLETTPENPRVGQQITVTGIFENVGRSERTVTLELRADGEVIASEQVTLAPGERETITGTVTFDRPGAYEVALGDSSITVDVDAADDSLVETGGFALPVLIGVLVVLAGLLLVAYRRRDDEEAEQPDT
jgi:hypothetical protein